MHTTEQFVALLQKQISAEQHLPAPASYYKVAKTLQISETAVLRWKDGKGTMSDKIALQVANRLQMSEAYVMACIRAEREKDPAVLKVWNAIAKMCGKNAERNVGKVASLSGAAILALLSMHAEPARADVSAGASSGPVIHYATLRRRRFRRRATDRMLPLLDPLQGFRTGFTARQRATA